MARDEVTVVMSVGARTILVGAGIMSVSSDSDIVMLLGGFRKKFVPDLADSIHRSRWVRADQSETIPRRRGSIILFWSLTHYDE